MIDVRTTAVFDAWIERLRDDRARARIEARIYRLSLGNAGDLKAVGNGVSELRIDYGPGSRLYMTRQGSAIVVLLCGGDKSSQRADIEIARRLKRELET